MNAVEMRNRWRAIPPAVRAGIVVLALLFAVRLIGEALDSYFGGGAEPGPEMSSASTDAEGLAAYAELLERHGHSVEPRGPGAAVGDPDADATLVAVGPVFFDSGETSALRSFVGDGGRLVVGGGSAQWLDEVLDDPDIEWSSDGPATARPFLPVPETEGIEALEQEGDGSWAATGAALPVAGDEGRTLVAVATLGSGRIVMLADPSMLQNRYLDSADNAAFGLQIAGPQDRAVTFVEPALGATGESGFAAIPVRWRWMLGGLLAAALVFMAARARRIGPPEEDARPLPPPRVAYVDAVATTLARTKAREEAIAPAKARARARVAAQMGLGEDAGGNELRTAAKAMGLSDEEASALVADAISDTDVVNAGRALARVERGAR